MIQGNSWVCRAGYERDGEGCVAIAMAAQGVVRGNEWQCRAGYRRVEDQ